MLKLDPDDLRTAAVADSEMKQLAEIADKLDESRETVDSAMTGLRKLTETMRVDSGLAEIELAVAKKLLRFNDQVPLDLGSDGVIGAFIDQLKRYLLDPTKFVLLDRAPHHWCDPSVDEGLVRPPQRSVSNASEAVLGTGFINQHVPAFTRPPMDELVDLRNDLDEPLGRYRRKVSSLRSELQTGPFDEHINAEVGALYRTQVKPAIDEIRQAMADHGFARELLSGLVDDLSKFVKGSMVPAGGVTLIASNAFDVSTAVTAGLSATAAITPTAAKALKARHEGRAAARAHDLYYLYEADRRLNK